MGQVPAPAVHPVGLVGDGRVARHIRHYLGLLGVPTRMWARRSSTESPVAALAECPTILLLIRDEAIVPFIEAWPELRRATLVHCSGSLVTDLAHGAHPLMTFGRDLYARDAYERIPFIVETGGPPLSTLLPGLPNPSFAVPAADRPYYHALCVMAGNFSTLLWSKLCGELEQRWAIPASAAHPFLAQTLANFIADGPQALTGPLARGDARTIEVNRAALEGDPFRCVYDAFVRAYDQRA